ncbi:MAG: hypothetical protein IJU83_01330 [Clostridia bacterium]|nr:hypothetical protein [Clostridia bacterium]
MKINYIGFTKELDKQFLVGPHLVTECLIRYRFIKAHSAKAEIEVPYRVLPIKPTKNYLDSKRARVDLYYGNPEDAVFEFKYHRRTKYSDNCTATKMGSVFRDLNRLSIIDKNEKYFIYVFDDNMKNYYENIKQKIDIFKISKVKIGNTYTINTATDTVITLQSIREEAFSGFNPTIVTGFKDFYYTIEVKYVKTFQIVGMEDLTKNLYLIILQVK